MWVSNVFGLLQLADSTNINISFGFSSFSELKKSPLLLLLSLYWVFLFFGCGILVPHIHPAMETWSPNHWTARGFCTGYFLKKEWMIHIYIKIVTYTIIPTQLLSTGHGSLMWVRKEGKEWEAITVYCWLFRRRQWHPTPVLLPGKSHGRRSLVDCSPWGREESDMTERLHFHFSLSCIGEGNGNPLQCSCLENPRDGGA